MVQDGPKGWHSRGSLPHFASFETAQHLIIRTVGSLPAKLFEGLSPEILANIGYIEKHLDAGGYDPRLTGVAAEAIESALLHFDGERYRLLAWCVMPNHVHVLIEVMDHTVGAIVRSWKAFTAKQVNQIQGTAGPVWARDYFDRYMRNGRHLQRTITYIENNPVAAGLVAAPEKGLFSSARL